MLCANLRGIALGDKPDLDPKWSKGSAIRYLKTGTGTVRKINGLEEAEKIAGVIQVSIVHGVGEQVVEIKSSVDRAGFVVAQAENAQKAVEIAEAGISRIKVEVGD